MYRAVDFSRVAGELELERTLEAIPPQAESRGIFFSMVEEALARRRLVLPPIGLGGHPLQASRRPYLLYPTRDFVAALATAGAMVHPDAREGMREIFSDGPRHFSSSLFGRAFRRFLHPNPMHALTWIERSRDHVANYGHWRLEVRSPEYVILHMFDEYVSIDWGQRGGCEGLLIACGVVGDVTAEIDTPFQGRLAIRWERPARDEPPP